MANVQTQFEKFHEAIRTDYDTNDELRDKRDILLNKIEASLKEAKRPTFKRLMQGSYAMGTGVLPKYGDKEYDIDVGLRFEIESKDYTATEVRGWVFDAVKNHTKDVTQKGPCIRVRYVKGYHVDLVCYAWWKDAAGTEQFRLAHKDNKWLPSDPPKLLKYVEDAQANFKDTDGGTQTNQLRRIIRCLKRWDDFWQPDESDDKPSGLAFTLLSITRVGSRKLSFDGKPDDRSALHELASYAAQQTRLVAAKPTPEYEDVFGKLNEKAMSALISRFGEMKTALEKADKEADPVKACELLATIFGEDFPVPPPAGTGQKTTAPAIVTSSSSA